MDLAFGVRASNFFNYLWGSVHRIPWWWE